MADWSPVKIKVVLELAKGDEKGLSNKEIAAILSEKPSHISTIFKKLRKEGLITERESRYSKRTKKGDLDERSKNTPYSLIKDFSQKKDFSYEADQKEIINEPFLMFSIGTDHGHIMDRLSYVLLSESNLSRKSDLEELAAAFNNLINRPCIYDEPLFRDVTLRKKTVDALNSSHEKEDCKYVNRLLLEDAYPFYLSRKSAVKEFSDMIKYLIDNEMDAEFEQFLGSKYISNIIDAEGFFTVFDMIEKYLERKSVRKACSVLLKLSHTGEQFEKAIKMYLDYKLWHSAKFEEDELDLDLRIELKTKYNGFFPKFYGPLGANENFDFIFENIENSKKELGDNFPLSKQDYWARYLIANHYEWEIEEEMRLDILLEFDPMDAVVFFRFHILKYFKEVFRELRGRSIITQSMQKFLEDDMYLSPLTSYPFNDIKSLLFYPPFQRIYEDVFILSLNDCDRLIERARLIYENFSDFLLEDIKTDAIYAFS